jgi:hypothetical protein
MGTRVSEKSWFMEKVMEDIIDGAPPTIIIAGPRRRGKTWLSLKLAEEIVKRCHQSKYAYRDKGMKTEKKYDLRDAQFDVPKQVLYSLRTIPQLLSPPPPLGIGLPYGSVMISDETSVSAGSLNFNSPVVKRMAELHDTSAYRLIVWILNVPGSVLRAAYQLRETAEYFMQMQARGVAKVYSANPSVTGRVWVKTIGWLGYKNPFTKRVVYRVEPPSEETLRIYNDLKDFNFGRLLRRSEQRLAELAQQEGQLGPYDFPEDYADLKGNIMMMPKERKHKIPTEDLEEDDEGVEG